MDWQDESTPIVKGAAVPSAAPSAPASSSSQGGGGGSWQSESTPIVKGSSSSPAVSSAPKPATYDDASALGVAGDTAYRAANTGTLGALDYGLAGLHAIERGTGYDPNATDLATIHKQGDEWGANHPLLALGADVAGYGVGLGKVGLGARLATRLGEGIGARVLGGAAENVGASLVGDELHSEGQASAGDLLKSALISGTVGAVTGALPGSRGSMADTPSPKAGLDAAKQTAFKPLTTTHYDPNSVASDFSAATSGLKASQTSSIGDKLDGQINKITQSIADKQKAGQSITADDITKFQIQLNAAARGDTDVRIAQQLGNSLDKTMANTKPLYSPLSGPAAISAQSDAAREAAHLSKTNKDIEGWMATAPNDLTGTQAAITKKITAQPNLFPTVGDNLKAAAQPPGFISKLGVGVGKDIAGAAAGGAIEGMFGSRDPMAIGGGILAGAAAAHGAGAYANRLRTQALLQKLAAARYANANAGQQVSPTLFRQGFGPMGAKIYGGINAGAPGLGASGRFLTPDQP